MIWNGVQYLFGLSEPSNTGTKDVAFFAAQIYLACLMLKMIEAFTMITSFPCMREE